MHQDVSFELSTTSVRSISSNPPNLNPPKPGTLAPQMIIGHICSPNPQWTLATKSIKNVKNETSKKNPKVLIALRNICTKFGIGWKIFKQRNDDTFSVTHTNRWQNQRMRDILVTGNFVVQEMWKAKKKVLAYSVKMFGYHNIVLRT